MAKLGLEVLRSVATDWVAGCGDQRPTQAILQMFGRLKEEQGGGLTIEGVCKQLDRLVLTAQHLKEALKSGKAARLLAEQPVMQP